MKSTTTQRFGELFNRLPQTIQRQSVRRYALWRNNPRHPSLHFKQIKSNVWSIRINDGYRALGKVQGDEIAWFWIGTHREYEKLIRGG